MGHNPEWLRILFYQSHPLWGAKVGLIDDASFYLSPFGKTDPVAELRATLSAFKIDQDQAKPDEHALCRFPARRSWIEQHMIQESNWSKNPRCPRWNTWWQDRTYEGLSIVFSSFFPDSPASMFGHIFLRLHRPKKSSLQSELLDDIVNFAANTTTSNPLTYNFKGAFGGFLGRFALMPYYIKIQEYNNIESRDLWEYKLNTKPEQRERMLKSLWEFGPHYADYYYFDDNCSYVLLMLLETADPTWEFTSKVKIWATPSASLKAIVMAPDFVQSLQFRPSALSRYSERYDQLDQAEAEILKQIIGGLAPRQALALAPISTDQSRNILDAALEYVDFKEHLGGSLEPQKLASMRNELLDIRRTIKGGAHILNVTPGSRDPSQAMSEQWLMLGGAKIGNSESIRLSWQPVLHDLLGRPQGFAEGMQIQIMPMDFDYKLGPNTLVWERFDLLNIASIRPQERLLGADSWTFNLGWQHEAICSPRGKICSQSKLEIGKGLATNISKSSGPKLTFAGLVSAEAGAEGPAFDQSFGGLGPSFLLFFQSDGLAFRWEGKFRRRFSQMEQAWFSSSDAQISMPILASWDLRGTSRYVRLEDKQEKFSRWEGSIGALHYF